MGKAEVGTPKYLANKMKAKGLQKLRWYCQMCQKQCRDENGFKCHTSSESHQRNLLMFADNSKKYMDEFSGEFKKGFMDILRRQFGTKRVAANKVYQDYIADRNHIHMNSTRWVTLTGFVKYMGRAGLAVVDETEKGWFITYIDREPETLAKQERKNKKQRMDRDDEEKLMDFVEKQVQRAQALSSDDNEAPAPTELVRESEDEKISLQIKLQPSKPSVVAPSPLALAVAGSSKDSKEFKKPKIPKDSGKRKLSVIEETMKEEQERAKHKKDERESKKRKEESWLLKGIVVKIVTDSAGVKYLNQKGVVESVGDDYRGVVRLLESGSRLKLDQAHLQTVIPQPGKQVKIVRGPYRNQIAYLKEVLVKKFCAVLIIKKIIKTEDSKSGTVEKEFPYEDFSKLFVE